MSTPHPIGKDELEAQARKILLDIATAKGTYDEWRNRTYFLITAKDLAPHLDAYTIKAEKRAELRGRIDEVDRMPSVFMPYKSTRMAQLHNQESILDRDEV